MARRKKKGAKRGLKKTAPPPRETALPAESTEYDTVFAAWDTEPLPPGLHAVHLMNEPSIPSPLNQFTPLERTAIGNLAGGDLIQRAFATASSASQPPHLQDNLRLIRPLVSEVGQRAMYYMYHLCDREHDKNNNTDEETDALTVGASVHGRFKVVKSPCTWQKEAKAIEERARGFSKHRIGAAVQIHTLRNRESGIFEHFIINDVHSVFCVNGVCVPDNTVAGPLSDFAVIQVGLNVNFWWSNGLGFDYRPPAQKGKRPHDGEEEPDLPTSPGSKKAKSSPPDSPAGPPSIDDVFVKEIRDRQIEWVREGAIETRDINNGMELGVVTNAIATIWSPLQRPYGFGMPGMFEIRGRDTRLGKACGQHHDEFLIPLVFAGRSEKDLGHLVLAVARKLMPKTSTSSSQGIYITRLKKPGNSDSSPKKDYAPRISLRVWDSRPGIVPTNKIQKAAEAVVRYSGWLGQDLEQKVWDATPVFEPVTFEDTPNQGRGSLHCGLYVIFKAWALMLGIETTTLRNMPIPPEWDLAQFHEYGAVIVKCALQGCMDTNTIRAFFATFGYSVPRSTEEEEVVDNVRAVRMDDNILNDVIVREHLDNEKRTEAADARHQKNGGGYI